MAIRVKSQWHTTGEAKSPKEVASVVASLIFRVAEEKVTHMQQADFEISSKEQGFAMISEYLAFLLQYTDRFIYHYRPCVFFAEVFLCLLYDKKR